MKGSDFKQARKNIGFNQQQLADAFGVSRMTIFNIESSEQVQKVYILAMSMLRVKQSASQVKSHAKIISEILS